MKRSVGGLLAVLNSGEGTKSLVLLGKGLEATVTDLGGSVDEFHVDLLSLPRLGHGEDGLADNDGSLLGTLNGTLEEEEVVVDFTVVGEATHGGDVLLNGIVGASGVVLDTALGSSTDTVDLVVDLGSGVVAALTSTRDRPLDGSWMPGTNASNLSETSVSLTWQLLDTEALHNTLVAVTLGHTDSVAALVVLEDLTELDFLLELAVSELNLLGDVATVNLDFHDVGLVLTELEQTNLGSDEHTHDSAVLLYALKITLDGAGALGVFLEAVRVLGEGLLLGVVPVSVETALDIGVEVLGPNSGQLTEAAGGLNVTDQTNDLDGRALNDGGGLNDILLDDLLALTSFVVLDDVGHASLVADESGHVARLGGVILGEVSYATSVDLCASLGEVSEGSVAGSLELSVRHTLFNNDKRRAQIELQVDC